MKQAKIFLFVFTFVTLLATQSNETLLHESTPTRNFTVKCLLLQDVEGLLIETKGPYKVINPENNKILSSGYFGKRYFAQCSNMGLSWGENYIGIHQIKIIPSSKRSSILIDGIEHLGTLYLYQIEGRLTCINESTINRYLENSLSQDLASSKLHPNTLEALAIISRTNLHYQLLHNSNPFFDVKLKNGLFSSIKNKKIKQAIDTTENLVLNHQGIPFPTTFTKNCSGNTASFDVIFRQSSPAPQGVFVSYSKKMQNNSLWKFSISKEELAKACHINSIDSIKLFIDSCSQKVYALRLISKVTSHDLSFFKLQELLGNNVLKSNNFSVSSLQNNFTFSGSGEGHGVGVCLLTADKMAQNGKSAPQILKYFYPDTSLTKSTGFSSNYKKAFEKQLINSIQSQ